MQRKRQLKKQYKSRDIIANFNCNQGKKLITIKQRYPSKVFKGFESLYFIKIVIMNTVNKAANN